MILWVRKFVIQKNNILLFYLPKWQIYTIRNFSYIIIQSKNTTIVNSDNKINIQWIITLLFTECIKTSQTAFPPVCHLIWRQLCGSPGSPHQSHLTVFLRLRGENGFSRNSSWSGLWSVNPELSPLGSALSLSLSPRAQWGLSSLTGNWTQAHGRASAKS